MPSMADIIAAQAGGGPVYEGGENPPITMADVLGGAYGAATKVPLFGRMLRGAASGFTLPGDVYAGRVEADLANPEYTGRVGDLAQSLFSVSPTGPSGSFGIFGGQGSRTADKAKLAKASGMAVKGAPAKEIWDETGWFQGPEGLWRYEIPDRGSGFRASAEEQGWLPAGRGSLVPPRPLPAFYEHPELYEAYPKIANYKMFWGQPASVPEGFVVRGGIDPEKGIVFLNQNAIPKRGDQRSALLHELQHGVQYEEGFARGGSPEHPIVRTATDAFRAKEKNLAQDEVFKIYEARDKWVDEQLTAHPDVPRASLIRTFWQMNPEAASATASMYSKMAQLDQGVGRLNDLNKFYRSLGGEVEARTVQERRNFGEKRREIAPFMEGGGMDTPYAEQLLRLGD